MIVLKLLRKYLLEILFGIVFLAGMSLLLYPTVSNWWNERHTTKVVNNYVQAVEAMDPSRIDAELVRAQAYNDNLRSDPDRLDPTAGDTMRYMELLNVAGDGVMGYIEIPSISVKLAIYHTAEEKYLQIGVGHLEGTSLPIGGPGTNCFLSGHRGLPSSKLFSDLDKVRIGDIFRITTLGRILTYQVDQIDVVLPDETADALAIRSGQDMVTLVTCTPYGVNTHRLLVRGTRIGTIGEADGIVAAGSGDADRIEVLLEAACIAAPAWILFCAAYLIIRRIRNG